MELYPDIRAVPALSGHMDIFSLIKGVDHGLLYFFVKLSVQRVNPDHFIKDLRVLLPNLRHRIGNDRETPLFSSDIFICDLPGTAVILERQLPLLFRIGRRFRHCFGRKRSLPEGLHHRRPRELRRQLPVLLIHCAHDLQPALDIALIHKEGLILTVVILVLPVCHRAVITDLMVLPLCDHTGCRPVDDRF